MQCRVCSVECAVLSSPVMRGNDRVSSPLSCRGERGARLKGQWCRRGEERKRGREVEVQKQGQEV